MTIIRRVVLIAALMLPCTPGYAAEETPPAQPTLQNDSGAGDLLVAPTRVVLEGRNRAAEIVLNNRANKEATYRVSFLHLRMKEDGSYEEISEETAKNSLRIADDLLRYSPRQVTLKPGESQIVKIVLRKPEGLADGEYTSHLLFRAVPDLPTGEDVEAKQAQSDQIAIKLIPVYGVSIPVLVRAGEGRSDVTLEVVGRTADNLTLAIHRNGGRSAYGDITITQNDGKNIVGQAKGVSILSYLDKRIISVPLTGAAGALNVEFRQPTSGHDTVSSITAN